jgi:glycosyltransferase involved in cell wall biosynthesis
MEDGLNLFRANKQSWISNLIGMGLPGVGSIIEELIGSLRMLRRVLRFRPEIVHGNDVNTLLPAWLAAKLVSARLVYDAHEISADREGYSDRVSLVRFLERSLGNSADARLTTTQMRGDWFRENYGFRNVHVVQNRPAFSDVSSSRLRKTFSVPDDSLVLLYQGGLQIGRGLRNLIQAVRKVPGVHLALIGDGPQRQELYNESVDLRERVHFVGQVGLAELPYWTASADVGIQVLRNTCLNHYTTDSNKLFEYVMGGLPVVASDFPEIRYIVDRWQLGILVDPEDIGSIAAAIRTLRDEPNLRDRLSINARKARSHLDWSSQESSLLNAYNEALRGSD